MRRIKGLVAALIIIASTGCASHGTQSARDPAVAMRLDHAAVFVDDIDAASRFLTETVGWRRHPMSFGVPASETTTGAMDLALIDANGFWLELVAPTSPGPGMDVLARQGRGHIGELAFETRAFDEALRAMAEMGVTLQGMDGAPLQNGGAIRQGLGRSGASSDRSVRIAYWPKDLTRGTSVELYEYRPEAARDVFTIRDRTWSPQPFAPNTPRLDRIAIIVADAERTARFYTDVVGLKRHPETFKLDGGANARSGGMQVVFVDAGGVWLALVQPVGPGPLMDYLTAKGDGFIAELIAEVDDLGVYYDAMKAKGIHMVDTSGNPLDDSEKAHVLEPYGDRIAYFPTSVSHGIVIEISQRGPAATSLIATRGSYLH